jgi:tetratricopeptide (TPR) repeat protein
MVLVAASCGGRGDPLDPRDADRLVALAATPELLASARARELALRAFLAREHGDAPEAERLLGEALKSDPRSVSLLVEHAAALAGLERRAEAEGRLRRALELDPTAEHAWLVLAEIEERRGDPAAAREAARRAIRAEPLALDALLWLAGHLSARQDLDAAEELLARVLVARPDDPRAHLALADVLLAQGDLGGARRHLRRFAEIAPAPGPDLETRARAAIGGDPAAVADILEIAAATGGAGPGLRLELARLLIADGRRSRALRHLAALPPADSGDLPGLVDRARLFLAAGRPWEARRLLLEEPAATLADPRAAGLLVEVETALGREEAALALERDGPEKSTDG